MVQHIVIDIETNGTCAGIHNLLSIGAVHHQDPSNTFYGEMRPLNDTYEDVAYEVNGFTHDQVQKFPDPQTTMVEFYAWVKDIEKIDGRVVFVSDTTSFDFSFVNLYLWKIIGHNPFGHAPLSLTNLYKGVTGDLRSNIYKLRDTKHTHHALDDAKGNQEAFTKIIAAMHKQQRRLIREKNGT